MKAVELLRDLRATTKMIILSYLIDEPTLKSKNLANLLNMTIPGIAEYINLMKDDGFVREVDGLFTVTKRGVEFLHKNIITLKRYIEQEMKKLKIIHQCGAIAKNLVKKGTRVYLIMNNGILWAYTNRKSNSTGIAMNNAKVGDYVLVTKLEGIVPLQPGKLRIVRIPEHLSKKINIRKLSVEIRRAKKQKYKIGTGGLEALVLMNKLNVHIDFQYLPVETTFDMVVHGIDVLLVVSEEYIPQAISLIEDYNLRTEDKIEYQILNV